MNLSELLTARGIDPQSVIVLRHSPSEPKLRKVLPWLAAERPEVFNAFQQTQGEKLERAMKDARTKYVASFIATEPGKALFIGLYAMGSWRPMSFREFWQVPANIEMRQKYEMRGFQKGDRSSCIWFDLELTSFYRDWKGKLIIRWPPPERSWWRRAHRNDFSVISILDESLLTSRMPAWSELTLSWAELSDMPTSWRNTLAQWRGIYFIFDEGTGKGYVGAAYGANNILGRWLNYAARGHGGNRLLRTLDPSGFRFSILELVSPTLSPDEVIEKEVSWKRRLRTRAPFGLNDN